MPFYEFDCLDCQHLFTKRLSVDDRNSDQECPFCGEENTKRIINAVGFVLKGDGWPGKNIRIQGQMAEKNRRLSEKEKEQKYDAPKYELAPNVGGERTETWEDAQKLAKDKGKDTTSYDQQIRKEREKT